MKQAGGFATNKPTKRWLYAGGIDGLEIWMYAVREFRDGLVSVHGPSLIEEY